MWATRWLALSVTLALAEAEGDFILPGVTALQARPKRQSLLFPDSSPSFFEISSGRFTPREHSVLVDLPFSPSQPDNGPGRFAPISPSAPIASSLGNAEPNPEEEADAALELPEDLDLNTMDRGSLTRINSIDNISAFADLFDIDLSSAVEEPADLEFTVVSRFASVEGPAEMATMATCKPELRTVELDLPVEASTLFYPTCVRLERCGGCCYGPLLTCRPTATKVVRLKVLKTVVSRGRARASARARVDSRRQRRRRRRRRETMPSYHEVDVIKHVQCGCGCKVQQQDCNPAIHNYMESECACVCKRKDEKKKCEKQNNTKYWDNDSCACYCRQSVDCGTGEFFSQDSCKCERPTTRGRFPVDREDRTETRRRPFERSRPRRPVRIPLRADEPPSSGRPTLLSMIHAPRHEPPF